MYVMNDDLEPKAAMLCHGKREVVSIGRCRGEEVGLRKVAGDHSHDGGHHQQPVRCGGETQLQQCFSFFLIIDMIKEKCPHHSRLERKEKK